MNAVSSIVNTLTLQFFTAKMMRSTQTQLTTCMWSMFTTYRLYALFAATDCYNFTVTVRHSASRPLVTLDDCHYPSPVHCSHKTSCPEVKKEVAQIGETHRQRPVTYCLFYFRRTVVIVHCDQKITRRHSRYNFSSAI